MVVVCFAAVFVLWPYFKEWSPLVRKVTVGAGALAILMPLVLLHVYWPPYFDTTASSEKVEYEFKSMYCAAQFHAANYDRGDRVGSAGVVGADVFGERRGGGRGRGGGGVTRGRATPQPSTSTLPSSPRGEQINTAPARGEGDRGLAPCG
jgi:hypothetical protein